MKTSKSSQSTTSIYRNQNALLRILFERAGDPRKVHCVALDYAKRKHVALCCDGNGEILRAPFAVDNTVQGVTFLIKQITTTARRRKIAKCNIFLGGEWAMSKILNSRWFLLALRVVLGGVFVYAGTLKIGNPLDFADSIATFQILPPQLINLVALSLPPFEILVGGLLIFGIFQRQAAFSLLLLTGLFMLFLVQAIARGLDVDCGCFGSGEPSALSAWISLSRDALLLTGCWWVYRHASRP